MSSRRARSQNPVLLGNPVTFTVSVTPTYGGVPTGNVVLTDSVSGTLATLSLTGSLMYTTSALSLGDHTITATYGGDGSFTGSNDSIPQTVASKYPTTSTIASNLNPSFFGTALTFTITVLGSPGTPTGSITLTDSVSGGLGTFTLSSGSYTYGPTSSLSIGSHTITVVYNGDTNFSDSTATFVQLVLTARGDILYDLPGFAIFTTYSSEGDTNLPAWASFTAVPATTTAGTPVYILWTSNNVITIEITEVSGSPPNFPVVISTSGSGIYEFLEGFTASAVLVCTGYDVDGNTVATEDVLITIT